MQHGDLCNRVWTLNVNTLLSIALNAWSIVLVWFQLFRKRFWFKWFCLHGLRVYKRFGLVFVLYKWFRLVFVSYKWFGFKAKKSNQTGLIGKCEGMDKHLYRSYSIKKKHC